MSVRERQFRSRLAQVVTQRGVIRGTLLVRRRVCGKPTCRCARGERHESLYLAVSEGGRTRQLFVPRTWEAVVRQWVADYRQAQDLLEEISRLAWQKVRARDPGG